MRHDRRILQKITTNICLNQQYHVVFHHLDEVIMGQNRGSFAIRVILRQNLLRKLKNIVSLSAFLYSFDVIFLSNPLPFISS